MIIASLLKIAQNWKTTKMNIYNGIDKLIVVYSLEYYTAIKQSSATHIIRLHAPNVEQRKQDSKR